MIVLASELSTLIVNIIVPIIVNMSVDTYTSGGSENEWNI
jgi:hypothetical protein